MKIGVVTYWYGNSNYGMIMQCWALQQYLKKMGHEPYVIRYKPERPWYIRMVKWCLKYLMCVVSSSHRVALKQEKYNAIKDEERGFDVFRKLHLDFSERVYKNIGELRRYPPVADCYIAGSDQIWCSDLRDKNAWGYYLTFGDDAVKRVAYAPSFGHMKYDKSNEGLLSEALSCFNAISCRESNGVELCNTLGFVAKKVMDPTILLSSNDYLPITEEVECNDYIFIYSVNVRSKEDIYWDAVKTTFSNMKIVVTPASGSISGGELFGNEVEYDYAKPGQWLALIKNANMVITSSFHGIVFSVLFNKPFAFVPLKGQYITTNNRIVDLLTAVGLDCLIVDDADDYKRILGLEVDWDSVNEKKKTLIKESIDFLIESI